MKISFNLAFLLFLFVFKVNSAAEYKCGVGIYDITGPVADLMMMGYAKLGQIASGLHFRLYSRCFVFQDSSKKYAAYCSNDLGMMSLAIKQGVLKILQKHFGNVFDDSNLMLAATHTHSGPGGYEEYLLYALPQGFDKENFKTITDGISRSIVSAMQKMESCDLLFNEGDINDVSVNRSPTSYLNNPAEERAKYKTDTDKTMSLLKIVTGTGKTMGTIAWFPVHGTSMNNSNSLVSGDNKGYAAMRFEQDMNPGSLPGKGPCVAAFPNSNEGDASPNINGPRCINTGAPCEADTSTCPLLPGNNKVAKARRGRNVAKKNKNSLKSSEYCIASGPGNDMFQSTYIIGEKIFKMAKKLSDAASQKVSGGISCIHQYVDMSSVQLTWKGSKVKTCKSAMGTSFAAGTTDGPGVFLFTQGTAASAPLWNQVRNNIPKSTRDLLTCHAPKPILLPTGNMKVPYDWQPQIVPTQIMSIGYLLFIGLPGEFTTMSGRRIRETVQAVASKTNPKIKVILSGLTNMYASYITTNEEYQKQRYEAASTIFGPHTLEAYRLQYQKLAQNLVAKTTLPAGPSPPDLLKKQLTFNFGVLFDGKPPKKNFGDVKVDVKSQYSKGETVVATFVAASPRNDQKIQDTYLSVEYKDGIKWVVVATDAHWETKYIWKRINVITGESECTVLWQIPSTAKKGVYRIRTFGVSKNLLQKKTPYTGTSKEFNVV